MYHWIKHKPNQDPLKTKFSHFCILISIFLSVSHFACLLPLTDSLPFGAYYLCFLLVAYVTCVYAFHIVLSAQGKHWQLNSRTKILPTRPITAIECSFLVPLMAVNVGLSRSLTLSESVLTQRRTPFDVLCCRPGYNWQIVYNKGIEVPSCFVHHNFVPHVLRLQFSDTLQPC